MKEEKQPSCALVWRPGPTFSLSIPFVSKENEAIVVRDSWMRDRIHKLPHPSWGSWLMDVDFSDYHLKHDGHQPSFAGNINEFIVCPCTVQAFLIMLNT